MSLSDEGLEMYTMIVLLVVASTVLGPLLIDMLDLWPRR
jgi:hypothetical protein